MKAAGKRILVVENDPDTLFLLEKTLTAAGYTVDGCANGSTLVELKHQWPDLFILDKELPSIDGIAISKFLRIHKSTREIPIIMISAFPVKNKAQQAGIDFFVQKPFQSDDLMNAVKKCISEVETELTRTH